MNEDIADARAQAAEHRTIARTLVGLAWVFLVFAGIFLAARDWPAALCAVTGLLGFTLMARREWQFSDQWEGCAHLWEQETAQ